MSEQNEFHNCFSTFCNIVIRLNLLKSHKCLGNISFYLVALQVENIAKQAFVYLRPAGLSVVVLCLLLVRIMSKGMTHEVCRC